MRKVINKMVTEEDLIRTVATAYGNGWRQVKLYFMCGLPTETDEDVARDRRACAQGHREGPGGQRDQGHPLHREHRRVRAQAAHPVPVGGAAGARADRRAAGQAARRDPRGQAVRQGDRLPLPRRQARRGRRTAQPRRPPRRRRHRAGVARRRPLRRLERALQLRPLDGRRRDRARGPAGRRRLVHHPRAGAPRGPAVGPPGLGPGQGLALGGLAGLQVRGRGRGLPLDAVLRLRRVPDHGHPDPGRPDRRTLLPAVGAVSPLVDGAGRPTGPARPPPHPACSGCGCATPSAAGCASPATATSSARSSGRCGGPGCRSRSARVQPAPQGQLRQRGRHRAWPARPSTSRSAVTAVLRPRRRCGPRSTRPCRPAWTCSRSCPRATPEPRRPARGLRVARCGCRG